MRACDIFFESVGIRFALELCVKRAIVIPSGESSKGYQLFKITARMSKDDTAPKCHLERYGN